MLVLYVLCVCLVASHARHGSSKHRNTTILQKVATELEKKSDSKMDYLEPSTQLPDGLNKIVQPNVQQPTANLTTRNKTKSLFIPNNVISQNISDEMVQQLHDLHNHSRSNKSKLFFILNKDKCYPRVGCFSMKRPWQSIQRPVPAPEDPNIINTRVLYFSRRSQNVRLELSTLNKYVSKSDNNIFIVHGFISSTKVPWVNEMMGTFLSKMDCNVFLVDWENGAMGSLEYIRAVSNIRIVAREIVLFISKLIEQGKAKVEGIHLLGHSLGAHVMSYVGKAIANIGRLTALDPAMPLFEGYSNLVRLDKLDAQFVEVIHSNSYGLGMVGKYGHVDYYMNGGVSQPGCTDSPIHTGSKLSLVSWARGKGINFKKMVSCHHGRAVSYYLEAIKSSDCTFWGHAAYVTKDLRYFNTLTRSKVFRYESKNSTCSYENCVPLGLKALNYPYRGPVYVKTSNQPPYCIPEMVLEDRGPAPTPIYNEEAPVELSTERSVFLGDYDEKGEAEMNLEEKQKYLAKLLEEHKFKYHRNSISALPCIQSPKTTLWSLILNLIPKPLRFLKDKS